MSTQLTTPSGYDVSRMVFNKPRTGKIPNSNPPITYQRIDIGTLNEDGTQGDLVLGTSNLFSYGVQENKSLDTGNVSGYVMPICLWNRNGVTDEEKDFTDTFNNIVDKGKKHLLKIKDEIEKYDLADSDLKRFNPLYYKKDKGKVVDGSGPTLYVKLLYSNKTKKVGTMFVNEDTGEDLNPLDLQGKYCFVTAAIKIESIYIGAGSNKMSLQVKLYEASVRLLENGRPRLLPRPVGTSHVEVVEKSNVFDSLTINTQSGSDEEGSLQASESEDDDEEEEEVESPPKKKVVKKVIKRRVVKKSE